MCFSGNDENDCIKKHKLQADLRYFDNTDELSPINKWWNRIRKPFGFIQMVDFTQNIKFVQTLCNNLQTSRKLLRYKSVENSAEVSKFAISTKRYSYRKLAKLSKQTHN